MSTFTNSEDPDEMQHNATFHQGLHCKGKKISSDKRKDLYIVHCFRKVTDLQIRLSN